MSATNEKIYYQDGNVLITSTRAEMAGKTFVMTNITSVSMATVQPNTGCATWLLLGGIALALVGFGAGSGGLSVGLIGAVVAVLGFLWIRALKPEYAVNLSSASGETRALKSTDREDIGQIVAAIKQAVIESGVQKVEAVSTNQTMGSIDDHAQKLKSLKGLLDTGVLSQQEYETKKAEILSRM